jgi:hypothetical protein
MHKCDPNESLPVTCAEAFRLLSEAQARANEKLDAIHEQAVRTHGSVGRLSERSEAHGNRIVLLEAQVQAVRGGNATWGRRIWELIVGLALLAAGYFLKS